MDAAVRMRMDGLDSPDEATRYESFLALRELAGSRVDWADEAWDELAAKLGSDNSYHRTIGIVLLCDLAASDASGRMRETLPLLLRHTRDESFIVSRQCLQNIWKVAAAEPSLRDTVVDHLERRFLECADEKHANLLRLDALGSLKALGRAVDDEGIAARAESLAMEEDSDKYRKQYLKALRS